MARPLRIEYPGAVYHITSRGNARQDIYIDDADRKLFLDVLTATVLKYNWICYAYCLMGNHYHLMIETPDPNISLGMRQLNGVYTQHFNRKHSRVGHVFQGRFKAILVEKESYLLELCRYIVLNPVAAGIVSRPEDYSWSSFNFTAKAGRHPDFLSTEWLLRQFAKKKKEGRKRYRRFVTDKVSDDFENPWKNLTGSIILGRDKFIAEIRDLLEEKQDSAEIPKQQRYFGRPSLKTLFAVWDPLDKNKRNSVIHQAHILHGYTLKDIGTHLGIHYTTVSRVITQRANRPFKT